MTSGRRSRGVSLKEVADTIGQGLGVPVASLPETQAADHFGGLAFAVGTDLSASSTSTRQRLGWEPSSRIGFIDDVERSTAYAT